MALAPLEDLVKVDVSTCAPRRVQGPGAAFLVSGYLDQWLSEISV